MRCERRLLVGLLVLAACAHEPPDKPGVFVLGVDGMDPQILRRLMDEGKMPAFAKLAAAGSFQPLGTSTPPQSPVAWSTFVTGLDPGGHGIFDFVHRDPKTYTPISSATPPPAEPGRTLELFGYYLPIGGSAPTNNRGGVPFWDSLHAAGVDVEVYRMPGAYPPTASSAKVLSGMGTVDMRGGYGVYTWFTDRPVPRQRELKGDIQLVSVQDDDLDGVPDTVRRTLKGPPDLFHLPPGKSPEANDYLATPVTIRLDPQAAVALVEVGDARAVLKQGEWSDWLEVKFHPLPGGVMSLTGMVRFYAKELRPGFQVYASPVNIAPEAPAQTISTPSRFAPDLASFLGPFYTQGMPEETNALKDRMFSDDDYVSQVALVQHDEHAMLDLALHCFARGDMTFMYLSDIDLQCHMLWRHKDPKYPDAPPHPAYDAEAARAHADDIEGYYRRVDGLSARSRRGCRRTRSSSSCRITASSPTRARCISTRGSATTAGSCSRTARRPGRSRPATSTGRRRARTGSGSTASISTSRDGKRRASSRRPMPTPSWRSSRRSSSPSTTRRTESRSSGASSAGRTRSTGAASRKRPT
jgi:hypothetical protein